MLVPEGGCAQFSRPKIAVFGGKRGVGAFAVGVLDRTAHGNSLANR